MHVGEQVCAHVMEHECERGMACASVRPLARPSAVLPQIPAARAPPSPLPAPQAVLPLVAPVTPSLSLLETCRQRDTGFLLCIFDTIVFINNIACI